MMLPDTLQVHLTNQEPDKIWTYIKDIGLPLIFLIFGAMLGFGIEYIKNELLFRKKRKYFFHVLYELTQTIQKQVAHYNEYIGEIDSKKNQFPLLKIEAGFGLDKISIVSKEDLYKIFILGGKKKDKFYYQRFIVLTNGFNLIQHHNNTDYEQDSKLHDTNSNIISQFNASLKAILRTIDEYRSSHNDGLSKSYNIILNNYPKSDISIYDFLEIFLNPLIDLVKDYEKTELIHQLSGIIHLVEELKLNRNLVANKFRDEVKSLNNLYIDYNNTLYFYKKYLLQELKKDLILIKDLKEKLKE